MICSISYFTSITAIFDSLVKLPNGQLAKVTHIGTVKISVHLILTNILCIPSFTFNLIFAIKLVKSLHCCLIFLEKFCFIQSMSTRFTIGLGRRKLDYSTCNLIQILNFLSILHFLHFQ
jgi:hypothetical protein